MLVRRTAAGRPAVGRLPVKNKSTYRWSTLQPNIKVDTSLNVNLQDLTNGGVGKLVPSLQDDLNNIIWSFFMFGQPAAGRPSNHKNHYIMLSKSSCNDGTNFPTPPLVRTCKFTFNDEVSTKDMCFCSSWAAGRRPAVGQKSAAREKTSTRFWNCATFGPKKLVVVSCVQVDTLRPILCKNMHINERLMILTSLGPYFDMGLFGNWHESQPQS